VDLVEYWLRKVAGGEGGTYDIDRVVTGFSTTQRGELIALRDIIAALSLDAKGADEDEILRRSVAAGIPDHRVKELLTRLSKEGDIYSPTPGKYRLLQRL